CVVPPRVLVGPPTGVRECAVQLDAKRVPPVDAVRADPRPTEHLADLELRARQPVRPFDVPVITPFERRLDPHGNLGEQLARESPVAHLWPTVELAPERARGGPGAHGLAEPGQRVVDAF